jgi:hypothetical protein
MPAQGTRGGILVACSQEFYRLSEIDVRQFSVTATNTQMVDKEKWTLTTVYAPQIEMEKISLMDEIRALKQTAHERWLLLGDFNLIYMASDKNNSNINHRLMNRFRLCLEKIEMKPIHLHDRRYTWTSGTLNSTVTPHVSKPHDYVNHMFMRP